MTITTKLELWVKQLSKTRTAQLIFQYLYRQIVTNQLIYLADNVIVEFLTKSYSLQVAD